MKLGIAFASTGPCVQPDAARAFAVAAEGGVFESAYGEDVIAKS